MKRFPRLFLVLATAVFSSLVASSAFAQVAGSIIGNVIDENGNPIGGVRIQARSETQIGGAKTTYTATDGSFRLPSLQPGTFEVRASAPKLKEVLQRDVQVTVTSSTEITVVMEVRGVAEEVQVIERAPTVSTTAANVRTVYDLEFVESLPIDGLATKVEPFVNNNTPGAGAGGDRFRGGTNRQNQFMVEGFSMGNQRYTMKSLATIEAQTAAYGAENANAQGAVVNMVTKSGSNKFEFDVSAFYEDNRIFPSRSNGDSTAPTTRLNVNPSISGPIIKDKLWFYANVEARHEYQGFEPDPAGLALDLPPQKALFGRGSFKLTWQISPRHKLSTFSLYNREAYSAWSDGNYDRESATFYTTPRMSAFTSLTWEALFTDSLFYRAQLGLQTNESLWIPADCADASCWHIPPIEQTVPRTIRQGNYEQVLYEQFRAIETINTLEWFPKWRGLGDHAIKLSNRFNIKNDTNTLGVPGDRKLYLTGGRFDRQAEFFSNDPRIDGEARSGYFIRSATGSLLLTSLSDSMRLGRYLTVNAGIALTSARSETGVAGAGELDLHGFTPHVSSVYDLTHDGRTVVRGSFANYVDADAVRISRLALGDQVSRECKWDDATQSFSRECEYRGGRSKTTFGLPCGPSGIDANGQSCRENLKLPRMWEYTFGVERELIPGVSLSTDLIYRHFKNPYEMRETNRIWNDGGSALNQVGAYRNGIAEQVQDVGTPAGAGRKYKGVTAIVRKREGRFKVQMGYTWSRLEGNVDNGGENNLYGDIPGRDHYLWGSLQDDHRHDIRGALTYSVTPWLSFGSTYSYSSGAPYTRFYRNPTSGRFEDLHARVGVDPGTNINDPGDDRALRLPDIQRLNLKVSGNLKPLIGHNAELFMDLLNVLNVRTPTAVVTDNGANFGAPRTLTNRTLLRLGGRYRY
jgi:hypothetical protein